MLVPIEATQLSMALEGMVAALKDEVIDVNEQTHNILVPASASTMQSCATVAVNKHRISSMLKQYIT